MSVYGFSAYDIGCAILALAVVCFPVVLITAAFIFLFPPVSADTMIVYTTNATDGSPTTDSLNQTWPSIHDRANADTVLSGSATLYSGVRSGGETDTWLSIYKTAIIFDTSALPDPSAISEVTVGLYRKDSGIGSLGDSGITIVKFNIDGAIDVTDYQKFDSKTLFSTYKNISTLTTAKYYNWSLNPLGISNISTTGNTGLGVLVQFDIENTTPIWAAGRGSSRFDFASSENIVNAPFLEITYTVPDTTPPDSITALTNTSVSCNQLFFNWTNPADADYAGMMLYRNNTQLANLTASDTGVSWDGLPGGTAITFSSRTFDSTGNVNATWVNATTTTTACPVPTTVPWESCFPWCGIQEIFFHNATSDISGYLVLNHIPELSKEREVNVSISSDTGSKRLGSWVTPIGSPGVTTIAPGLWRFRTFHNVSSQVGVTTLEFKVFNRSSAGIETDLFYGQAITKDINALDPTEYLLSYARRNATTLFPGDRLVIKVNASTSSVSARNVYMWLAGNTNTSMVQVSNFICCSGSSGCGVMVANELPIPFYIPLIAAGLSILAWRRKSRM
jgi:hypothetical protein